MTLPKSFWEELPLRSNEELQLMLSLRENYEPEAINAAVEEIKRRNPSMEHADGLNVDLTKYARLNHPKPGSLTIFFVLAWLIGMAASYWFPSLKVSLIALIFVIVIFSIVTKRFEGRQQSTPIWPSLIAMVLMGYGISAPSNLITNILGFRSGRSEQLLIDFLLLLPVVGIVSAIEKVVRSNRIRKAKKLSVPSSDALKTLFENIEIIRLPSDSYYQGAEETFNLILTDVIDPFDVIIPLLSRYVQDINKAANGNSIFFLSKVDSAARTWMQRDHSYSILIDVSYEGTRDERNYIFEIHWIVVWTLVLPNKDLILNSSSIAAGNSFDWGSIKRVILDKIWSTVWNEFNTDEVPSEVEGTASVGPT